MAIIRLFLGFLVLFYSIYTPIYIIFFDDGEDAVESASLADVIFTSQRYVDDTKSDLEAKKSAVKDFASKYEKQRGIDITRPIYKVLKKNNNVTDLAIQKQNIGKGAAAYVIRFKYNGEESGILFAVEEASFFNVKQAKAHCIMPIETAITSVGPIYGMSNSDIIRTIEMLRPRLPN